MPNLITLLFVPGGRASRKEYIIGLFVSWLANFMLMAVIGSIMDNSESAWGIVVLLIRGVMIYIGINLMVKRFHDLGENGAKVLLFIVPLLNVYYFFKLIFERGIEQEGSTQSSDESIPKSISTIEQQVSMATTPSITAAGKAQATLVSGSYHLGGSTEWGTNGSSSSSSIKRVILGVVGFAILGVVAFFGIAGVLKNSDAYKLSIHELETNPLISEIYGTFDVGSMPMGSIHTSGSEGEANLEIAIEGTKGKGKIYVDLIKKYGEREMLEMVSVDENNNQQFITGSRMNTTTEE